MSMLDFGAVERRQKDEHSSVVAGYSPLIAGEYQPLIVGSPYETVAAHLGTLQQGAMVNFWTFGRYAMHHVLRYVLAQTGPADVIACTWAIANRAVDDMLVLKERGLLRSFRLWIDPRVKVRNPEPLQKIQLAWPVAIAPVHAKVACICNEQWKVSVFGSLNFTTNPQPERGCVCTVDSVFERDYQILNSVFNEKDK